VLVKIARKIVKRPFLAIVFRSTCKRVQEEVVSPKTFALNGVIPAT